MKLNTGELVAESFHDYMRSCGRITEHFGGQQAVNSLGPEEFLGFRKVLAEGRSLSTQKNEMNRIRMVFKLPMRKA